jgi:branched-chain amino acid transport system permease protein
VKRLDSTWTKGLAFAGLMTIVCALPFLVAAYQLDVLIFLLINIIVVVSFRLLALSGEMSFAHVVIMGVGAYTSALLTKDVGLSPWLTLPIGGFAAAAVAYILSFPLFRMKGFYFVIGSFAAGEAIRLCWQAFREPFGASRGVTVIPTFEIGGFNVSNPLPYYYFSLGMTLICCTIMYRVEKSRFGLNLEAIHWQDLLTGSIGINARGYRVLAFVVASFFAGIAGVLFAHYITAINPRDFSLMIMLSVLVWVLVGGISSFSGPIIGVTVLSFVDLGIRAFEEYRPMAYGLILIVTMLFLPEGLQSIPRKLWNVVVDYRAQRHERDSDATAAE